MLNSNIFLFCLWCATIEFDVIVFIMQVLNSWAKTTFLPLLCRLKSNQSNRCPRHIFTKSAVNSIKTPAVAALTRATRLRAWLLSWSNVKDIPICMLVLITTNAKLCCLQSRVGRIILMVTRVVFTPSILASRMSAPRPTRWAALQSLYHSELGTFSSCPMEPADSYCPCNRPGMEWSLLLH